MSLRVIHVASGREWRGGQRQVWYLAQALATRGVAQVLVTGRKTQLERRLREANCSVVAVEWESALSFQVFTALLRILRQHRGEQVLLHAHDPHALTHAIIAGAWHRVPVVVTRRVDFPLRRPSLWRRARRVIAISEAVRRVLAQSGVAADRIVVVPSGIPLPASPPEPLDLRARLNLPADARLAVAVGALVAHKDYPTLIRAAALLGAEQPRLHWIIAGEGPDHAGLQDLAAALGVRNSVHLIGQVEDGREVIAAADLFVVTSREEGLNTSVLDALALGVPVVSTDAGGLPEAVGGAGVLCPRGDAQAVAREVAALLDDPMRCQSLAAAGRLQVARFSSDRMAEGMLAVYHSVASSN